ncbi:MmcQ/YjbR family DNA-binding protein [Aquimarina brevivitae]|uniref:Putative DNA-binding protein (MmcQ/YjbR family) n=1 Tax=Aquimarina brevivitae TaxID=323412 RepID=A0A4Q7PGT1_9FLAO|nr:MmcQ/YjbR family DNA-binding protein [Aquimarina brevivitae]RZS99726.1 putative DNA-binding protein (MmcQ/YjbR family) [Aquimarina brevivitae]
MNIEEFRNYCLAKKGVTESFPFDQTTLVFKVMGKMFALTGLDRIPFSVNLKCDPERAITLREHHPEVQPGYHMNKKHWNTINFSGNLATNRLYELINHSYDLVVSGLPKKDKEALENL